MSAEGRDRARLPEWEESTERRIGILEHKIDKLLDPETGIYSHMTRISSQLSRWAIAILTGLLVNLAFLVLAVLSGVHR